MVSEEKSEAELDFRNADELNQQRRVYNRKPKQARDVINNVIARRGIAVEKSNHQLQNVWDSVVGMDIANQTKLGNLRRNILEIIVTNSSLMQILGFNKHQYIEKLNQEMRTGEIKDIRFRIGRMD